MEDVDSDYEFQIKPDPYAEEPHEAEAVLDEYDMSRKMAITTRPEIRKGCTWDVNFSIDPELLKAEGISKIFLQQPKSGKDGAYLQLKVRSKLIKPILELPFIKVAKIVNERDFLSPNDAGLVVLKARFTARPRAVFHKHADVMILLAAVKIGERIVCADKLELIFRGGTGSVHGAEGRVKAEPQSFPMLTLQQMQQMQQMGIQLPLPMSISNLSPSVTALAPLLPTPTTPASASTASTATAAPATSSSFMVEPVPWDGEAPLPQYDTMNSADIRDDFLQNKGDSLMLNPTSIENTMNMTLPTFTSSDEGDWPMDTDNLDGGFVSGLLGNQRSHHHHHHHAQSTFGSGPTSAATPSTDAPTAEAPGHDAASNQPFTLVFGKRRSVCTDCVGECSYYKGLGGPCNECGCYPARHVDLDASKPQNPLKRSASSAGFHDSRESKKPRFLLEAKFFQKLFFSCMQYMTLSEIARVANSAPIPIFVKDEKSVYIYINPTFCHFITDLSKTERVLNHTPSQLFSQDESNMLTEHDNILVQQGEGTVKIFDVSIRKQEFRVMKEYCSLRDGKKVFLGAVISSV